MECVIVFTGPIKFNVFVKGLQVIVVTDFVRNASCRCRISIGEFYFLKSVKTMDNMSIQAIP